MAPFMRCYILKYSLLIFLTLNVVHGGISEDFLECMDQLKIAYGDNDTSTGCFAYAVEHYKKGEFISVEKTPIPSSSRSPSNENQNVASSSRSPSNPHIIKVNNLSDLLSPRQADPPTNVPSTSAQVSSIQAGTTTYVDSFKDLYSTNQTGHTTYVDSFNDLFSTDQAGPATNVNSNTDWFLTDQAGSSQHPSEPPTKVRRLSDQTSSTPTGTTTYVDSFNDFFSTDQAGPTTNVNSYTDWFSTDQADENQNVPTEQLSETNYATIYFKELEKMIQEGGIMAPMHYCRYYYLRDQDTCMVDLLLFGSYPKEAVTTALTLYRLSECNKNGYIYKYMQYIINNIDITNPSKKPERFCKEIYRLYDWYLEYKGIVPT